MRSTVRETLKVKRSKVKVTRSCDVVAQKHRIYPVNVTRQWKYICLIGNRGRRSDRRGQIFDRKHLNSRFCACAVKICTKLDYNVVKSPQFQSFYKKSWSLNTTVRAFYRPEAELMLFLRMRTKEIAKTQRTCILTEELVPCYRKQNRGRRSECRGQMFDWKLVKRRFCTCAVNICPKLAYYVVKSPQFQPLYKQSWSMNTTVFKPDTNLILSGNCNKPANINVKKTYQFKTVFNGDTAYVTQLKRQKSKRCYYLGAC